MLSSEGWDWQTNARQGSAGQNGDQKAKWDPQSCVPVVRSTHRCTHTQSHPAYTKQPTIVGKFCGWQESVKQELLAVMEKVKSASVFFADSGNTHAVVVKEVRSARATLLYLTHLILHVYLTADVCNLLTVHWLVTGVSVQPIGILPRTTSLPITSYHHDLLSLQDGPPVPSRKKYNSPGSGGEKMTRNQSDEAMNRRCAGCKYGVMPVVSCAVQVARLPRPS